MELHVGTSGYSYREWKGPFYPDDLPAKDMLTYYGSRLDAVEINNTFYRLPKSSVLESWAAQVPEGFRFSIKASRRITHMTRLKPEARDPTEYLLSTVAVLGARLGVVLFQLPPNMKLDLERFERFIGELPEVTPAAFEFRHDSWGDPAVHELLRSRGFALVSADTDDGDGDAAVVETTDWGYLRLRRSSYEDADLRRWAGRISSTGWKRAYVFFKHEDEGAGPLMAARFKELAAG